MSNTKVFSGNQYYILCFLKISIYYNIFEKKTYTTVCSEASFSKNSYHIETSQLITLQINWPVSTWYDFSLKGVSEQTLIIATAIHFRIIFVLYGLYLPYEITNALNTLQNLCHLWCKCLRGCRHITFVMLNGFCPLSKSPPPLCS